MATKQLIMPADITIKETIFQRRHHAQLDSNTPPLALPEIYGRTTYKQHEKSIFQFLEIIWQNFAKNAFLKACEITDDVYEVPSATGESNLRCILASNTRLEAAKLLYPWHGLLVILARKMVTPYTNIKNGIVLGAFDTIPSFGVSLFFDIYKEIIPYDKDITPYYVPVFAEHQNNLWIRFRAVQGTRGKPCNPNTQDYRELTNPNGKSLAEIAVTDRNLIQIPHAKMHNVHKVVKTNMVYASPFAFRGHPIHTVSYNFQDFLGHEIDPHTGRLEITQAQRRFDFDEPIYLTDSEEGGEDSN